MARSVAVNVAANTSLPGFRGPIYPDGTFTYVPIPEREPTSQSVPTYADLDLPFSVPADLTDVPVHLDPEFAEYPCCESNTYGDDYGVKARPIGELEPGDSLFFYATLSVRVPGFDPETPPGTGVDPETLPEWMPTDWGTYLIGRHRIDQVIHFDTATDDESSTLEVATSDRLANNAHVKRDPFDAKVLVIGTEASGLFDRAIPLCTPDSGSTANRIVTTLSSDSGKGPWWRRPLRFNEGSTKVLEDIVTGERPVESI